MINPKKLMRQLVSAALITVSLMLGACGSVVAPEQSTTGAEETTQVASYQTMSAQEAIELMEANTDYVIVDVRTAEEYAEGHIPDAINIPVDSLDGKPAELGDEAQLILVYCRSGNRSARAAQALAALGYTNVVDFGGISSWPGDVVSS